MELLPSDLLGLGSSWARRNRSSRWVGGVVFAAPRTVFRQYCIKNAWYAANKISLKSIKSKTAPRRRPSTKCANICHFFPRLWGRFIPLSGRLTFWQILRELSSRYLPGPFRIARLVRNLGRALSWAGAVQPRRKRLRFQRDSIPEVPKPRVPGQARDFWGPSRAKIPRPV